MNPENILLKKEKKKKTPVTYSVIPFVWGDENRQIHKDRVPGAEEWLLMGPGFLLGVIENIPKWIVVIVAQIYKYAKKKTPNYKLAMNELYALWIISR